jgi:glucose-1-phosphate cytidylyltransferase
MTTVRAPARFGRIRYEGSRVADFHEKPEGGEGWINGEFYVLNRQAIQYVENDATVWEGKPLQQLAHEGELIGYRDDRFWSLYGHTEGKYPGRTMGLK